MEKNFTVACFFFERPFLNNTKKKLKQDGEGGREERRERSEESKEGGSKQDAEYDNHVVSRFLFFLPSVQGNVKGLPFFSCGLICSSF